MLTTDGSNFIIKYFKNIVFEQTSFPARDTKLVTVLGAVFPNKPSTILPIGCPPSETSKNTLRVTVVSDSAFTALKSTYISSPRKIMVEN